ncbi:phosphatidylinositol-4-phosphate 5-kinase-domain-containing protein [Dendryphion nanum]|uniref:Phosphatidylinositol-4-phosphate 5-kinase-domain-containing protein n=1 Tax=Dendryphion nanum TaxID=256645 RepID=A0A9P9DDE7_9PLEO|nr:phosphatidylinositol-4-phosphate 5-kinase-domain-containing protein [Dendryphion nanum]
MGRRQRLISTSILRAIFRTSSKKDKPSLLTRIFTFFSIFQLALSRYRETVFRKLRNEIWGIEEEEYTESFRSPSGGKRTDLKAIGDLGYSGSTFFTTPNSAYLLKSLPRAFEQSFFRTRLLDPYVSHMSTHPLSLLVRITDLLYTPYPTLGALLGTAASHHIIMENILYGQTSLPKSAQDSWETYDLKPSSYFFPERDVAGGRLAPESVKERLIDEFPDKIRVTDDEKEDLVSQLLIDTNLLYEANAVDYSLFLVRYPASLQDQHSSIPVPQGKTSPWRSGISSRDGKWIYRAVLLDFFWAKDAFQAQAMTGLVKTFNFLKWGRDHGPMSITTTSEEYRSRFMKMVDEMVEVTDSAGRPAGELRIPASGSQERLIDV